MLFTTGIWKRNPGCAAIPASIELLAQQVCTFLVLLGSLRGAWQQVPFKKLPDVSKWRVRLYPPSSVMEKEITFNLSSDVLLLKNGAWGPQDLLFRGSPKFDSM